MPTWKFIASTVPKILEGPKIPKVGHVTLRDTFLPNFAFYGYNSLLSVSMQSLKFLASTVPDILRDLQIPKVGHVISHGPF